MILKVCKICEETKNLIDFRYRKVSQKYSGTCKLCQNKQIIKSNIINNLNTFTKICFICKEETDISNFSYFKSDNKFSSYCKTCDSKRKKSSKSISKEYYQEHYKKNRILFLIRDYKKFDKKRNLDNDLTKEYIEQQLINNCVYCGYPSTGFDRIDNSIGHTIKNCVPCCRECNVARMDNFTHKETFIIGSAIKQIKNNRSCLH